MDQLCGGFGEEKKCHGEIQQMLDKVRWILKPRVITCIHCMGERAKVLEYSLGIPRLGG